MRSSSTILTEAAQGYMTRLCEHFAARAPSSAEGREARISFTTGEVRLRASPQTLMVTAEAAEPGALARLEGLVERHLKRLAQSEAGLAVEWRRAPLGV
ncbi:MAG: DUF2218 domain-containing protein [Caulobacteraceae bacterium]